MLVPVFTRKFEKDVRRARKRGKAMEKFEAIARVLVAERPLGPAHRDHRLVGEYVGRREGHIEPDWLLIYKVEPPRIVFERMGSHSDLFKQ